MKFSKLFFTLLLVLSLIIGMMPVTSLATETAVTNVEVTDTLSTDTDVSGTTNTEVSTFLDMPNNWSTAALQSAVSNGLLKGFEGRIFPQDNLTRAEMAAIIVRAFGATEKGDIKRFTDIRAKDWFVDDLAIAYKMGIIKGSDDGLMHPNNPISRQEVFIILARAFKLQPATSINKIFPDVKSVEFWAKGEVFSLVNNGYITGSNGMLLPKDKITRAEFAQSIYNILKQHIKSTGIYTSVAEGNVIITTPSVTLKNLVVKGDLVIGEGVGDGEVILDNVKVIGRMVVRGGGVNSIIIRGNSTVSNIVVARSDGKVSVKVQGNADVDIIYIDDGSDDVYIEGEIGNLEIKAPDIMVTTIAAQINSISLSGENSTLVVDKNSNVESLSVTDAADNSNIQVIGTVTTINTVADNTRITGSGNVETVNALAGASGTSIGTPDTEITVETGVTGVTGAGGAPIDAGSTTTNNGAGTGIITATPAPDLGGGGGGGGGNVAVTGITVTGTGDASTITTDDGTLLMVASVLPTTATNKSVTWTVTDGTGSATISVGGLLTAVSNGTVTVKATSVSTGTVFGELVVTLSNQVDDEITGFAAIANRNAGTEGSAIYANAAAVIAALPATATANTATGTVSVPVTTWVDTDTYDPATAGSYTFTATLGAIPVGFANTGNFTATVEVVVAAAPVNAVAPVITVDLADETNPVDTVVTLDATATVTDGGTVTYQWYSNDVADTTTPSLIGGQTGATYLPPVDVAGVFYYYCVVTNTNLAATGTTTATATSAVSTVTVEALVNAVAPVITVDLVDETNPVDTVVTLDATATVTDGGTVTYQWYSNDAADTTTPSLIGGQTGATYLPPVDVAGVFYYYCVVTNTNLAATGTTTATATSAVSTVTVEALVNAVAPVITVDLADETNPVDTVVTLDATATVTDGGTVTYQWYSNDAADTTTPSLIGGQTGATYLPPVDVAGVFYYYCVVTNTNLAATGTTTATATSAVSTVTVEALVNAVAPVITVDLADETNPVDTVVTLDATATVTDGGTVTYQWYSNDVADTTTPSLIGGQTGATYLPPVDVAGVFYYYCVVTNTNLAATGTTTATATSAVSTVTVEALVNAVAPVITVDLADETNPVDTVVTLDATATVTDGGTVTYQWYSNDAADTTTPSLIGGQTGATYLPPVDVAGVFYYYCVVTNTNLAATGTTTATATSAVSTVTVEALVNAVAPVITVDLADETNPVDTVVTLDATATVTDGGTVTYQWYSNDAADTTTPSLIGGQTGATYLPPVDVAGVFYYYCVVTNTNLAATGTTTATATSAVSTVTVEALVNAVAPVITVDLADETNPVDTVVTLDATATVTDGGTVTYQWYSNDAADTTTPSLIGGQTGATYLPPVDVAGVFYYYCVVTNTNLAATGTTTATATSAVSTVTVE